MAKFKVKVGYQGDFVYNRELDSERRFNFVLNQGVLTFDFKRFLEIYGSGGVMQLHGNSEPTWGAGMRGVLFRKKCTALNAGVAYQASPGFKYREWQAGIGLSNRIDLFIPYFGITFAGVSGKYHNKHTVGLALGCRFDYEKYADLTVEARVFDEQAFTLAANIKF